MSIPALSQAIAFACKFSGIDLKGGGSRLWLSQVVSSMLSFLSDMRSADFCSDNSSIHRGEGSVAPDDGSGMIGDISGVLFDNSASGWCSRNILHCRVVNLNWGVVSLLARPNMENLTHLEGFQWVWDQSIRPSWQVPNSREGRRHKAQISSSLSATNSLRSIRVPSWEYHMNLPLRFSLTSVVATAVIAGRSPAEIWNVVQCGRVITRFPLLLQAPQGISKR